MAEELLGVELDIHGGGADLLFPHHENEAAQTLAARGKPLARVWMHNGMLQLADEKMSKSEGNIRGLGDALDEVGRDALLLYFIGGHYRQPIAYTRERLDAAAASVRAHPRRRPPPASPASRPRTWRRCATRSSTRWPTTSTPREALAAAVRLDPRGEPARGRRRRRPAARDARGARRSTTCWSADEGPPAELVELAAERTEAASGEATSPRPTGCATRSRARGLGDPRRPRRPGARARGVIIYGRNAVTRGPRGASGGCGGSGPSRGTGAARRSRRPRRPTSPPAADRTPIRACARTSRSTATPTPPSCSPRPSRSWSRSTRSPTRRTSARSAARPRSPAPPA